MRVESRQVHTNAKTPVRPRREGRKYCSDSFTTIPFVPPLQYGLFVAPEDVAEVQATTRWMLHREGGGPPGYLNNASRQTDTSLKCKNNIRPTKVGMKMHQKSTVQQKGFLEVA